MRIHALTVCVGKDDHLAIAMPRWVEGLRSLTIVTDGTDVATQEVAITLDALTRHGSHGTYCPVYLHRTDAFTRDGAAFNKARAMEEARISMPWSDWILFIDADVVPPRDWKTRIEATNPEPGHLYGCWRYQCDDVARVDHLLADPSAQRIKGDGMGVGYFQLFHADDKGALGGWAGSRYMDWAKTTRAGFNSAIDSPVSGPLLETDWQHGGVYDCHFMDRWRPPRRDRNLIREIPSMRVAHLGPRDGWWGRGNDAAFSAMMAERRRRGTYDHERIGSGWTNPAIAQGANG